LSTERRAQTPAGKGLATLLSMTWADYFRVNGVQIAETAALNGAGADWRALRAAVENGYLVRARRGHYALPETDAHVLEAVRLGGRLACVSAAAHVGVFVLDNTFAHIHVGPTASRLRAPHDRFQLLSARNRDGVELHWGRLLDPVAGTEYSVGLPDALAQILRCQEPRFAIASLDNALHRRLIPPHALTGIFAALPGDLQRLRPLIDARSESGQETVLRFIVREAGFDFEIQVEINGVGRIDMIVEGRIAVEADSRQFHDGWEAHVRDRTRDCDLAMRGYMSLRVLYRDIIHSPERVIAAIAALLAASRRYRTFII
jgi:very-short-patch-repair endonuclease